MTRLRKRKRATRTMRNVLLGLGVGLLVVSGFLFIGGGTQDPAAQEAKRIQRAQERVQGLTPDPVPAPPQAPD